MSANTRTRATEIVEAVGRTGDELSARQLMPLVYDELKRLAADYLKRERPGHTLQATALVHEAYLKLIDQSRVSWKGRTHYFAVGAQSMRRILIDHARAGNRQKRGRGWQRVTLGHALQADGGALDPERLLALHEALETLAGLDERQARIVELRFFCGLSVADIAELLGVSKRVVEGDWTHARAWLKRELARRDR